MTNRTGSRPISPNLQHMAAESPLTQNSTPPQKADSFEQLRSMPVPPQDHLHFELPPMPANDFPSIEWRRDGLKLDREVVRNFFQGILPKPTTASGIKPLANFLLTNNLPNALSWLVIHSGIEVIDFSSCCLGDAGMKQLGDWIAVCPKSVGLSLADNGIGPDGARMLAKALPGSKISGLVLDANRIGDDGLRELCGILPNAPELRGLALRHTGVGNDGIKALADVLPQSALQALTIKDSEARIDNAGARELARALAGNPGLTAIRLGFSGVSDAGLAEIAQGMQANTQLKNVAFEHSDAQANLDAFPSALELTLRSNQTLKTLDLSNASLSEDGWRAISRGVRRNESLEDVFLPQGSHAGPLHYVEKNINEHLNRARKAPRQ